MVAQNPHNPSRVSLQYSSEMKMRRSDCWQRAILLLLIILGALSLQGCVGPAVIYSISNSAGGSWAYPGTVEITVAGTNFGFRHTLVVDGDGMNTGVRGIKVLSYDSTVADDTTTIVATLEIYSDAPVGQHLITVYRYLDETRTPSINRWESNAVAFEVRCGGCQPAPALQSVAPTDSRPLAAGQASLRFLGTNLPSAPELHTAPRVVFPDSGITSVSSPMPIEVHDQGVLQYFDVEIFIPGDVTTGLHTAYVVTNGGQSNSVPFTVVGNGAPGPTPAGTAGPMLSAVTPTHVGKGTEVFIKCKGSGFGVSRQVTTDPPLNVTTYSVSSNTVDPDEVAVAKIANPDVSGPIRVRVQNLIDNKITDEFIIFSDDILPGVPVAQGTTGSGVHRGGSFDLEVFGANLEGITDASWSGIPGLTFSNTTYGSFHTKVHIAADATAPLTADEATNLTVTIPGKGQSPPFLFRVFP